MQIFMQSEQAHNPRLEIVVRRLLGHGRECEWAEFKHNNSKPEQIGQYISALSNSAFLAGEPFGYLVFGVDDATLQIVGTDFRYRDTRVGAQELENWLSTQLDPQMDFRVDEFTSTDGFRVVVLRVDATRVRPVAFQGKEYIRVGTYKKPLKDHPEKERQLWAKASQISFETRVASADIDENEALRLLDYPRYFDLMGLPLPADRAAILRRLTEEKLLQYRPDGRLEITNLGAILFAKNLAEFDSLKRKAVRVIHYKGRDRLHTIREQEGGKGYASGFEGLIQYVNDQLPSNEEIGRALRKEVKIYPEPAVRELVANMLIHQDFDISGTGPTVEIFEDRVEISNPGATLIDPLRMMDHSPRSRNELLAYFMRRAKICEERGTGIDRVVAQAELYQLPGPKFVREEKYFRAILLAPKTLRQMNRDDKIRACYQHCCLRYLSSEPMSNESLRGRFRILEENYSIASRIISDTIEATLIKAADPTNRSKKHSRYVPFWA